MTQDDGAMHDLQAITAHAQGGVALASEAVRKGEEVREVGPQRGAVPLDAFSDEAHREEAAINLATEHLPQRRALSTPVQVLEEVCATSCAEATPRGWGPLQGPWGGDLFNLHLSLGVSDGAQ